MTRTRTLMYVSLLAVLSMAALGATWSPTDATSSDLSSADGSVCRIEEGRTILPEECSDPGSMVVADTDRPNMTVPVPPEGERVTAEVLAQEGALTLTVASAADGTVTAEVSAMTGSDAAQDLSSSPSACSDGAFERSTVYHPADGTESVAKWHGPVRWHYRVNTTPSNMTQTEAILDIQQGLLNNASARNDCDLPDNVSATVSYEGVTNAVNEGNATYCTAPDLISTFGFKNMGTTGTLAVTCSWARAHDGIDEIYAADVAYNTNYRWWETGSQCENAYSLQAIATHEAGHVLGLSDLNERAHGWLTMSGNSNGKCQRSEVTLGRGDVRGLESLY